MSKAGGIKVNYYVLICSFLTFIFLFSFTSALETSQWDYIPIGNITYQNNTYINQTLEEGVVLGMEIDVLRQAVYELKKQNEFLQEQINSLTGEDIDLSKANDRQDEALCSINLFDWCLIK